MRDSHLLSGLKQLRGETLSRVADIDKQIDALDKERDAAVDALGHIDAVLLQQDPGIELETIRARRPKGSCASTRFDGKRVRVSHAIMTLLRTTNEPLTVREMVERLQNQYPSKNPDSLKQSVYATVAAKKANGVLTTISVGGRAQAYTFASSSGSADLMQAA